MKWKVSNNKPKLGDKKTEMKWAWSPVKAMSTHDDQVYWVWMGWYTRTQEYMKYMALMPGGGAAIPTIGWCTTQRTVDTKEYIGKKW